MFFVRIESSIKFFKNRIIITTYYTYQREEREEDAHSV